jgi:syntaxin-binding protein 1
LDEDYRKPKHLADQLVRLLDEDCVGPSDRLRLILLYLLHREGLLAGDIKKLLAHGQLPPQDGEVIYNLDLLGVRVEKPLKDTAPPTAPLFAQKPPPTHANPEDSSLSRFEPNVKLMLQEHIRGTIDPQTFPSTRPPLEGETIQETVSQASLRSAKPTWARTRPSVAEPRQRIIVFMAGGATYSEARSCYEVSEASNKDVYLVTSHMLTPGLFLRQVGDLSVDKRRLDLPAERPPPKAPAHLFEREQRPTPAKSPVPPSAGLAAMTINSRSDGRQYTPPNGAPSFRSPGIPEQSYAKQPQPQQPTTQIHGPSQTGKLSKKDKDEKKRRGFFR